MFAQPPKLPTDHHDPKQWRTAESLTSPYPGVRAKIPNVWDVLNDQEEKRKINTLNGKMGKQKEKTFY